jgi:hypothetical protein
MKLQMVSCFTNYTNLALLHQVLYLMATIPSYVITLADDATVPADSVGPTPRARTGPPRSIEPHLWRGLVRGYILHQNQRQRGDTSWATHLNAFRDGQNRSSIQAGFDALQPCLVVSAGMT